MTVIAMNARTRSATRGPRYVRGTEVSQLKSPAVQEHEARRWGAAAEGTNSQRSAHNGPMTLTRRGRFVFFGMPALLTATVVLLATCAFAAGTLASPAQASVSYEPIAMADYAVAVTVLQGESLWSIASAADPSRDVREVVSDIVALNDLGSGIVQAGQRLYVPLPK